MDLEMQEHYFHSVPKTKDDQSAGKQEDSVRLCIVFRTGSNFSQNSDSGRPCEDLGPKSFPLQIFGNHIPGLSEGNVYTRGQLFAMGAHRMQQRGISGKIETGADAIIVSGLREDKLGCDRFVQFVYAVEQRKGGKSVLTSFQKGLPIRIFRSSHYQSPYKAVSKDEHKTAIYRYDGLYKVVRHRNPLTPQRPFIFELLRVDPTAGAGKDDDAKRYSNIYSNNAVLAQYTRMGTIQSQEACAIGFHQNLIDCVHDLEAVKAS